MKPKSFHDKPLHRQCEEAHLIETFTGAKIMNRKGEWGHNLPPKLSIEGVGETGQVKRGRPTIKSQDQSNNSDQHEPKSKRRRIGFQPPTQPVNSQKPAPLTPKQILNKLWKNRHVTDARTHTNTGISPSNIQIELTDKICAHQASNTSKSEIQ